MRVCFIWAEKADGEKGREFVLADNFLAGVRAAGDEIVKIRKGEISPRNESGIDADAVCLVGVKSLKLFRLLRREGKHVIYFDKGYFRHRGPGRTWEYWRVAANDHHPTEYMTKAKHSPERWNIIAGRRKIELQPWRASDNVGAIIYAGSRYMLGQARNTMSLRACLIRPHTQHEIIAKVKKLTPRQVIYRPKPTWYDAVPIKNSHFSPRTQSIQDVLRGAWCLLTNGSNASFDALIAGVPSVVLGNAITKPLYSHRLEDVVNPTIPTDEERDQWLANLAWCMFTEEEMREGLAWATIKPQLSGGVVDESSLPEVAGETTFRPSKAHWQRSAGMHRTPRAFSQHSRPFAEEPFERKQEHDDDEHPRIAPEIKVRATNELRLAKCRRCSHLISEPGEVPGREERTTGSSRDALKQRTIEARLDEFDVDASDGEAAAVLAQDGSASTNHGRRHVVAGRKARKRSRVLPIPKRRQDR